MKINGIEHKSVGFSYNGLWSELKLDDGTTLRVKLEVTKVMRAVDTFNEFGEPLYGVSGQTLVLTVLTPPTLMKPDPLEVPDMTAVKGKAN